MRILILLSVLTLIACSKEPKSPDLSSVDFTEVFYENGQLKKIGKYVNDKKEGEWKIYYKNGQLCRSGMYRDGSEIVSWDLYDDNGEFRTNHIY